MAPAVVTKPSIAPPLICACVAAQLWGDMRCLGGVRQRKRVDDRRRLIGTGRHP
jgi:hypothetical protein